MSEALFGDREQCTREQMTVMFVRALGIADEINMSEFFHVNALSDKDMISSWAKVAVEFSLASDLMKGTGDTTFSAKGNAQRQQVAVLAHRFINNQESILDFAKSKTNKVRYASLLTSLTGNKTYKGAFNILSTMTFSGTTPGEIMTMIIDENGAINGLNNQLDSTILMKQGEQTLFETVLKVINVDNKIYLKEDDFEWIEVTPEDLEDAGLIETSHDEIAQSNEKLINHYNQLPILFGGLVELNDVNTSKYSISLDTEAIKAIYPEDVLGQDVMNTDALGLDIDIYINEQNQVIRQTLTFNGHFKVESEVVPFNMVMDINYTNIGADIEITAPSIETTP